MRFPERSCHPFRSHLPPGPRRVSRRDRFIFFDLGVRNALLGIHKSELSPQEKGNLFEQWVLLQVLYYLHAQRKDWHLSAYRTDTGTEVDAVLETKKAIYAIECKWGKNVAEHDLRGLRSFEEAAHKPIRKFVICAGGLRQQFSKGETSLSYKEFFEEILPTIKD